MMMPQMRQFRGQGRELRRDAASGDVVGVHGDFVGRPLAAAILKVTLHGDHATENDQVLRLA